MEDFVPTRVSRLRKNPTSDFVAVNYEAPKKKMKKKATENDGETKVENSTRFFGRRRDDEDVDPRRQQELEMKRIRYEVIKFGMSGFEKAKAKQAKVALAVSLGAKPPKNRAINYKRLKVLRLEDKEAAKKEERVSGLGKSMAKHKTKKSRDKGSGGILGVYGKVDKGALSRKKK